MIRYTATTATTATTRPFASIKRVGVMTHWRIGPIGGSVYRTRKPYKAPGAAAWRALAWFMLAPTLTCIALDIPAPRLIGTGCEGEPLPIALAVNEDDFAGPCYAVTPIAPVWSK